MTAPKERPILMSAPMVRAILDGTKTQTRRALKTEPVYDGRFAGKWKLVGKNGHEAAMCSPMISELCPYGRPGDRLWVREAWRHTASSLDEARAITEDIASGTAVDYRATYLEKCMRELGFSEADAKMADSFERWRPSIHMPRWASRITLEITRVRVERLQDISDADAVAEGIGLNPSAVGVSLTFPQGESTCHAAFRVLWESINGPESWAANPWVWVIEFRRIAP